MGSSHFCDQNPVDDETLMLRVRDEDCLHSFSQLFQRWQVRIHRTCYRLIGNWQDAEDLTQEVFAKVYRKRNRYRVRARFGTWLWQVAINQTRDFVRKTNRENQKQEELKRQQSRSLKLGAGTGEIDLQDEIQNALLEIPEHYREIVVLRHFEGLQFNEIARLTGIPPGTVASRMARALRLLEHQIVQSKIVPLRIDRKQKPALVEENYESSE